MISSVCFTDPSSVDITEAEEESLTRPGLPAGLAISVWGLVWPRLGNFVAAGGAFPDRLRGGSHGRRHMASGAAYALLDYPPCSSLHTTRAERDAALAGDELIPDGLQSTRAITIQAPPDAIWPWLVQMGQDRGGFYSHDWLERLFGAEIHNADRIRPEWQTLAVGDTIWPYPERKLRAMAKSSSDIGGWRVVSIEAERSLVVQSNAGRWSRNQLGHNRSAVGAHITVVDFDRGEGRSSAGSR